MGAGKDVVDVLICDEADRLWETGNTRFMPKPKQFSFLWALLWFLVFGIGIVVYLIYYASR